MTGGGRSGMSPWLVGLFGLLLYRRGRRRGERGSEGRGGQDLSGQSLSGQGPSGPLREVRLPDGRDALEVTASLFEPDPADGGADGTWRRIVVDGTGSAPSQEAFTLTLAEVAPGARSAHDVPVVLMPLGRRRRVDAVDVYATGGRLGHLPDHAVRAVGESIRRTQLADGRPCAVLARIGPGSSGGLGAEVLLPETFVPGTPRHP